MRTATIESTISIKINVGNFESIDITKTVKLDVEFDSADMLAKKQSALDDQAILATKSLAEKTLSETGRQRMTKVNGADVVLPTWGK